MSRDVRREPLAPRRPSTGRSQNGGPKWLARAPGRKRPPRINCGDHHLGGVAVLRQPALSRCDAWLDRWASLRSRLSQKGLGEPACERLMTLSTAAVISVSRFSAGFPESLSAKCAARPNIDPVTAGAYPRALGFGVRGIGLVGTSCCTRHG
jgi:hypothetical protein